MVGGPGVTDASVEQLVKFKKLTELGLERSTITDVGLQKIKTALPGANVHR